MKITIMHSKTCKALAALVIPLLFVLSFACNNSDELPQTEGTVSVFDDPDSSDFFFQESTARAIPPVYLDVDVPVLAYNYNSYTEEPACGVFCIKVETRTGTRTNSATDKVPFLYLQIKLHLEDGTTDWLQPLLILDNPSKNDFQNGATDTFYFVMSAPTYPGPDDILGFSGHFGTAFTDGWFVEDVYIRLNYHFHSKTHIYGCDDPLFDWAGYRENDINEWVDNDQNNTMPSYSEYVSLNNGYFYSF